MDLVIELELLRQNSLITECNDDNIYDQIVEQTLVKLVVNELYEEFKPIIYEPIAVMLYYHKNLVIHKLQQEAIKNRKGVCVTFNNPEQTLKSINDCIEKVQRKYTGYDVITKVMLCQIYNKIFKKLTDYAQLIYGIGFEIKYKYIGKHHLPIVYIQWGQ
jgi:hypothetical protein